jgi:hypothetical protein
MPSWPPESLLHLARLTALTALTCAGNGGEMAFKDTGEDTQVSRSRCPYRNISSTLLVPTAAVQLPLSDSTLFVVNPGVLQRINCNG